ncbi:hypothetical protein J6590_080317 [Homalodisca vitripennis]|nr:hypothetical protein J6590_080317 [Homalodisca vitripennis]
MCGPFETAVNCNTQGCGYIQCFNVWQQFYFLCPLSGCWNLPLVCCCGSTEQPSPLLCEPILLAVTEEEHCLIKYLGGH